MLNDKIAKIAFFISITSHFLFFCIPGEFNFIQKNIPEQIDIEITIEEPALIPKHDVMGKERKFKKQKETSELKSIPTNNDKKISEEIVHTKTSGKAEEKTKIRNGAKETMLRYQDLIKRKIQQARKYPPWAEKMGIKGRVKIEFILLTNGSVEHINILVPSGYKILDRESVATIKRAGPFPHIPEETGVSQMHMDIVLVFNITHI